MAAVGAMSVAQDAQTAPTLVAASMATAVSMRFGM
jgi:hypothetical protein